MKKIRFHKPKPAPCLIPCECRAKNSVTLIPGRNDVHVICSSCGAALNIVVIYDGYGMATLINGTIEKVEG